ncbi:hypothetical protein ACFONG_16050 [Uliginosibacterium paludis]|uniref:Uncharacterized protein n=1 Tax=Uliginosibacterium paludis TaxID=1615952 RepID=A0ABV2CUG6_9RHOO
MAPRITPGPWKAVAYIDPAELIKGPDGQVLAMRQDDATTADMTLMAAAPELLAALTALVEEAQPLGLQRRPYKTALSLVLKLENAA